MPVPVEPAPAPAPVPVPIEPVVPAPAPEVVFEPEVPIEEPAPAVVVPVVEEPAPEPTPPAVPEPAVPVKAAAVASAEQPTAVIEAKVQAVVAAATGSPVGVQAAVVVFLLGLGYAYFRFLGSKRVMGTPKPGKS
ncbi:hypothetical protein ACRB8A_11505 [Arthrobacter sp. G.S.26]|uniref:hypothetical protein n=1 Tax=Arthrobacter sp. G.S.26 TaxID=3433706 RepID=UPI003D7888EA